MRKVKIRKMLKITSVGQSNNTFYDTEYPNEFPAGNYYLHVNGVLPSYVEFKAKYNLDIIDYFKEQDYRIVWKSKRISDKSKIGTSCIVFEKGTTLIHVKFKSDRSYKDVPEFFAKESLLEEDYASLSGWYVSEDVVDALVEDIKDKVYVSKSKSKISLLTATRMGMDTVEQEIKHVDIDIASHYGEAFLPVHLKIIDKLSEDKGKGLVLLHGLPGTGKTNYIRYLCGVLEKEIIFLPPSMAESIAGPDFITFLLEHTNSILVIEDAEKVVLDREGDHSSRQSVANLLNLTDGILSDCLSIQVIATFNTSRDRIDKALLRKGRLIAEWKFDALSVDDSNQLFTIIGKDPIATKPMTLTEIYNSDEEEYIQQTERKQIGFGR